MMLKHKYAYLFFSVFMLVQTISCSSGSSSSSSSNLNVKGVWHGTFSGDQGTNFDFAISITGQVKDGSTDLLYGTWSSDSSSGSITGTTGHSYSLWTETTYYINLTLQSSNKTCCDVFTNCSSTPLVGYVRIYLATEDIVNNHINNGNAQYRLGCLSNENGVYSMHKI